MRGSAPTGQLPRNVVQRSTYILPNCATSSECSGGARSAKGSKGPRLSKGHAPTAQWSLTALATATGLSITRTNGTLVITNIKLVADEFELKRVGVSSCA